MNKQRTYISLFSSAGVGCYGFKMNGFQCVATIELLEQRMAIQKVNKKCKYDSGYISGDVTAEETQRKLFDEIKFWEENENLEQVDVVFATPPCQGMSSVNLKKDDEQKRNSLIVEAIKLIKQIHPKFFVFENVRAFMQTICTDIDGEDKTIEESIFKNLSQYYNIEYKVMNFKDYGVPSSRPRTLVIGVERNLDWIEPKYIFPIECDEITLREAIGKLKHLEYGEKDDKDFLHFARPFPKECLEWIENLKEGQGAFDQPLERQPWHIDKNGKRVQNKNKVKGKYQRLYWDRVCTCIHTRNDVLSSQTTIHPSDNRVLSIRELMIVMTIPSSFKWTEIDDQITPENSDEYLKRYELTIRRCIGESVPTHIGEEISRKIKRCLELKE